MRILIANDDGYLAPGLAMLVKACEGLGELDVVAPEQNASGTSNSLTLNRGLSVFTAANGHLYINGTPSDCVHLALSGLLENRPDLVVSGINQGANMGEDTLYSGTVAAAMEGYLFGIPAIAFSQVDKGWAHLDAAGRLARSVIEHVLREPPQSPNYLLNVNIPNRADADVLPRRVTRLGRRHASYGVVDAHYATVGAALLATLAKGLGAGFDAEVEVAWAACYDLVATTMRNATVLAAA